MENLDYHTVMESRIRYFAQKYDPGNKLGQMTIRRTIIVEPIKPAIEQVNRKSKLRKRILAGLDSVISVFL